MDTAMRRLIRSDISELEEYTPIIPFEVLSAKLGFAPEELVKLDAMKIRMARPRRPCRR